ncbi:patatin-like phospholipase family protein [Fulvivirgaceae bacterium BMA12]|uniref:Patatin-like phospholipase family protein n=1 Tax=Agaribacillus aureus TaxID=3051825 RepID=A0ABT8L3P1_9BACT|nr:patatin-like phospholipase family protein [Fulvivirgaceae bacterium BMA12]
MIDKVIYSFPVQLLINHIRKNHALLFSWVILFFIVTNSFGRLLGIPYLFLDPEYLGQTNFWSFFITGIAIGVFIMAFNTTSYIVDAERFSFLAGLTRPFTKYFVNNSIIPLIFIITYIINIFRFQYFAENKPLGIILLLILGFVSGMVFIISLTFIYFWSTNKDVFKILASNVEKRLKKVKATRAQIMRKYLFEPKNPVRVDSYINFSLRRKFKLRKVTKNILHKYDKNVLFKVFDQNHLNSVILQAFIILAILILGVFRDFGFFQIPAAASTILFLTILIMIAGAITYWLRGWTIFSIIVFIIVLNAIVKTEVLERSYQAYGMDYTTEKAPYTLQEIKKSNTLERVNSDIKATKKILNNWRSKFPENARPKMVFVCSSGGGLRSALWTTTAIQKADSITGGKLMDHTMLMTGASGGLLGLSYFRELALRKKNGEDLSIYDSQYLYNIASDNLNPIIFTLLVNDLFIPFPQFFSYGGKKYLKDRGFAFEQQLNKNTHNILNKSLADYRVPEQLSQIPMLIMSPTIINDGRKMFISPQNISYMNTADVQSQSFNLDRIKGIEFRHFFRNQASGSLRFLSALRMSATFPYITPNISLPSEPPMEIMDSGISDNFGIADAIKFLFVFKSWISENTGGVVILSLRDSDKDRPITESRGFSLFQKFFTPIRSLYVNWDNIQDFNNDNLVEFAQSWFDGSIEKIELQYVNRTITYNGNNKNNKRAIPISQQEYTTERASLSWRLTGKEKKHIIESIESTENQIALAQIKRLLQNDNQ